MDNDDLKESVSSIGRRARQASLTLATLQRKAKDDALQQVANAIEAQADALRKANRLDLEAGERNGLSGPLLDRLRFTDDRIDQMAQGVRQVAALDDPVGAILESTTRPNGLRIDKVRVPIGVVGIIYESRPNVTVDCAALCLKSGNAAILRGGSEAFHSNSFLAKLIQTAIGAAGLEPDVVQLIPTTDRAALSHLLTLKDDVHCIIPRGGEGLIDFVSRNSLIPVIKHYKGVCNAYVDADADLTMAESIVVNAKTQRVSVCNAIENLFIHKAVAHEALQRIGKALTARNVELRCDPSAARVLDRINQAGLTIGEEPIQYEIATDADFFEEYLDYKLAIKVVDSDREAVQDINRFGSGHSDTIITESPETAEAFMLGVDSATVYHNASTRFTDGFEFGLGAEIGISTDRLHARGPMGLRELCTYKFKVHGNGQIR